MAAKERFKVGDLVKLKSGGPVMTVGSYLSLADEKTVTCQWFAAKKLNYGRFPEDTLDAVRETEEEED